MHIDTFGLGGLRRLMLTMLAVHLKDSISGGTHIKASALEWFNPPENLTHKISFKDCAHLLGGASAVEAMRERALQDPEGMLQAVKSELTSMQRSGLNYGEGDAHDESPDEDAPPAGLDMQLLTQVFPGDVQRPVIG